MHPCMVSFFIVPGNSGLADLPARDGCTKQAEIHRLGRNRAPNIIEFTGGTVRGWAGYSSVRAGQEHPTRKHPHNISYRYPKLSFPCPHPPRELTSMLKVLMVGNAPKNRNEYCTHIIHTGK